MITVIDYGTDLDIPNNIPKTYTLETYQDVINLIVGLYEEDDLASGEFLTNFEIHGLSIETVTEMYIDIRGILDRDKISSVTEDGELIY